jgi:predicted nuclease with RNAse H fold
MGIDLAGKKENPSGICIIKEDEILFKTCFTDEEIIETVEISDPKLIVIDAPLSLPRGRCCLERECQCASGGHFRQCEREIRRYGPVLPLTFQGMKMLTMRGISLKEKLEGYQILETHPHTVQKMLGIEDINDYVIQRYEIKVKPTEHEFDAFLAAYAGIFYLNHCYIELGKPDEGTILLPDKDCYNVS